MVTDLEVKVLRRRPGGLFAATLAASSNRPPTRGRPVRHHSLQKAASHHLLLRHEVDEIRRGHRAEFHRSEEHTSELQSREKLVCRLLLEKKKKQKRTCAER